MSHPSRILIRFILACTLLTSAACGSARPAAGQPLITPPPTATAEPTATAVTAVAQVRPEPSSSPAQPPVIPVYGYRVIHTYPHDTNAFTEGLVYADGYLYEGTGLYGSSELRQEVLTTGVVVQRRALSAQYFGEGVAVYGNKIAELTWQSHTGFVLDRATFALQGQFGYSWEGWGLTYDGSRLIMSDGTPTIHFLDPATLQPTGQITVTAEGQGVRNLNELEWVNGEIYANVWMTDRIARISPATGDVTGWIDLTGLRPAGTYGNPDAVLNGIAYDVAGNRLFVTGKLWPSLFEIQLVPKITLMLPLVANAR
jgi:glutamine cyclotransferase